MVGMGKGRMESPTRRAARETLTNGMNTSLILASVLVEQCSDLSERAACQPWPLQPAAVMVRGTISNFGESIRCWHVKGDLKRSRLLRQ